MAPGGGKPPAAAILFAVLGLLIFGTITSISAKLVYELQAPGRNPTPHLFEKPWAMTALMFLGMSFCLPAALREDRLKRAASASALRRGDDATTPLLPTPTPPPEEQDSSSRHSTWILMIPALFDLIATALMNVGLLSVTASVYQMMRGAELLFAALFSITFLHRRLNKLHFTGIACCIVGLVLVGLSSAASGSSGGGKQVSPGRVLLGMGLIIASQAVQAAQITFEDFFMSGLNISPLKIVAFEGVFGFGMMALLVLPIVQFLPGAEGLGIHEDTIDSLIMTISSHPIFIVLLLDLIALCLYNITGMQVTGHLGAVSRTVLETSRTIMVWLVGLALYYLPILPAGSPTLGEPWTKYSPIQAFGFCWLVAGTMTYVKGDLMSMEEEALVEVEEDVEDRESGPMQASVHGLTPGGRLAGGFPEEGRVMGAAGGISAAMATASAAGGLLRDEAVGSRPRLPPHPARTAAIEGAVHGHTPPHPSMLLQRNQGGIAIKAPTHAASSFKSTMSLVSTSLGASLQKGSYIRPGTTTDSRGPFRMSGVNE